MEMNNEIIEQLIEQGQPPKRTRGRPFGTFKENNITADEKAYNKLYYKNVTKPLVEAKGIIECMYCHRNIKYSSLYHHNNKTFCKIIQDEVKKMKD